MHQETERIPDPMSKSITQDMAYWQSLMRYTEKYGVSRASRKYEPVLHLLLEGAVGWGCGISGLPSHPNQHTQEDLKLIQDIHRRNPDLDLVEPWSRLRLRGYTRCPESLYRVMRRLGRFPAERAKNHHKSKSYEQMTYPGQENPSGCEGRTLPLYCRP